ncbi:DUF1697 domain-containing protein [soil metagenome]|jgi:uncharacterized protein (DUF1697 family)
MARHVAFLRGINLGATRRVPMNDLRAALEQAGYTHVRTLLQSGNVVLTSTDDPSGLESDLAEKLRDAFGFDIAVLVRTRDELANVITRDPFGDEVDDPARYQVSFLSAEPEPARVEDLERADVAPERVAVLGREIYAWHPGGVGRSELAKRISGRRLGVEVTARNWRTVTKLLELADAR